MTEKPLLGVWRLVSLTSRSRPVLTGQTHLVVREHDLWEVWPREIYYEDRPGPVHRYSLRWRREDGMLETVLPHPPNHCGIARISGDELQIRWGGVAGRHPDSFEDEQGTLATFTRERDDQIVRTLLEPPKRVARTRRWHPTLRELTYDAGLKWWQVNVRFGGVDGVRLAVEAPSDAPDQVFDRAADVLSRVDCNALRAYAASQLYDVYDSAWRSDDGPDVDENGFAELLVPESFTVRSDGQVTVFFEDGDLFWGHAVIVNLDAKLVAVRAEMAG